MSWLLKVTHLRVTFFKLLDKKFFEKKRRLDGRQGKKRQRQTRRTEKKQANTKGEAEAKKRRKEIDLGNWKISVEQKGSGYDICY
jgi:hypothetical protein